MGNFINRVGNTAAIPVRVGGTVVTTSADLLNTFYTFNKEGYEVLANTSQQIKDVFLGAWNHGKWYHKAMNIPLSPVIAAGSALEGVARSVVQPVINGVVNTRNTGKNFFKNTFRNIGRVFSKKPVSDFSYDHMKTRPLTLNNWFTKLQFKKGEPRGSKKGVVSTVVPERKVEEKKNKEETPAPVEKEKEIKKEEIKDKKIEEKKVEEKKKETKPDNKEEKKKEKPAPAEKEKIEDSSANIEASLKNSKHGINIFHKIKNDYPELKFVVDDSSSIGSVIWSAPKKGTLTVGGKVPTDEKQIAPLNSGKNPDKQKSHVILHELGHIMILDNLENKNLQEALEISKKYVGTNKTLTPLAHLGIYDNTDKKAKEDLAEMISLCATKDKDLDTYLSRLTSDKKEDKEYRTQFGLAKIDNQEAKKLKDACTELVSLYSKEK